MPSQFSSQESKEYSQQLAKNLGIGLKEISIQSIFENYKQNLKVIFKDLKEDITEENLQARIRGTILMALSNKFGWLVVTTGNKSEMSTGYATLYGDMAGGFALLKDVPKTLVFELAKYFNKEHGGEIIPKEIIERIPTAELKSNQKDSDSLPEYDILDEIIKFYVEENCSSEGIVKKGIGKETVEKVISLIDKSEYKRRQSPPGLKITPRAFGKDRRMPITNRYKG
jgi:NAD+ synthase (glutamine-hydrolysing)